MSNFKNICIHLKTVRTHRKAVRYMCFHMGLIKQGLLHDLSKYSPTEMSIAKYAECKNDKTFFAWYKGNKKELKRNY